MKYWLLKTEPETFSLEDLKSRSRAVWDGVRNYTARNNLRSMGAGDLAFIYHSSTKEPAVVGVGEVVGKAFPDPSQFKPTSPYFEPKARRGIKEIWTSRTIRYRETLRRPVTLTELKGNSRLKGSLVVSKGARLSVQSLKPTHFREILAMGNSRKGP